MRNLLLLPIAFFFKFVLEPAAWLICLPLRLLQTTTPLDSMVSKFTHAQACLNHLESEAKALSSNPAISKADALLIHGKRREYAELLAPSSKYPSLYVVPPRDLARSLVTDGRLINGMAPAKTLAGKALSDEFVTHAWASANRLALRTGWITLVVTVAFSAWLALGTGRMLWAGGAEPKPTASSGPLSGPANRQIGVSSDPEFISKNYVDVWSRKEAAAIAEKINAAADNGGFASVTENRTTAILAGILTLILLTVASLLLTGATARIFWLSRFRYLVYRAADESVEGLRHGWREALQRWRWRLPDREMELASYDDQVRFATQIDKSPLIDVGVSLGVLEHRGHLLAPPQDTPVRMSVADLLQHVDVLGGSGEGKSRNFYIPVVRQLLQLRQKGYPIALYATDDKGAIGADIQQIAAEVGLPESDVLVVGTGPDDWRVDLLDGLEPVEVADIIKSVAKQAGGEAGDDFWPEMASDLLLQVAVVLQAAEFTEAGEEWVRLNNMRMYSLLNILRVASDDAEIIKTLEIVIAALADENNQYRTIAHLDKNGLKASISYLVGNWLSMVDATKDGIRSNARKALRSFAFRDDIAYGFADGAGEKLIAASELISNKVKIINIAASEGSAQRMVAIMLKTLLFKQARDAEKRDPTFAKERLRWWFNPQPGVDADRYAINIFLADEYQGLVTSSGTDGVSDATVWNVLRSAGVAGILLSQSVSAYRMAIGDKPTDNMRKNWRTKIVLRTEDLATIEEAKKLAGKTMRFQSLDWNHMEGSVAVRRETGMTADSIPRYEWNDQLDGIKPLQFAGHMKPFRFAGYNEPFELDSRFITTGTPGDSSSAQAAYWRQEDRASGILQHGSSHTEAVQEEDLMQMGRGRALVFVQRAGGTRVEIVKLYG